MPAVEAAACGVPVAAVDYSAMEDVVRYVKGYPINTTLEREMETNADRGKANNKDLAKIMLSCAEQSKLQRNRQRVEVRKGCIERYTWDLAAKRWEEYLDKVEQKGIEGRWDHPPLINKPVDVRPEGLDNHQYCEWICTKFIQDQHHAFNYKMLSMLRDLNFGATVDNGSLATCDQDSLFETNKHLAKRRYVYDAIRTGSIQVEPQRFIQEAHRRVKN